MVSNNPLVTADTSQSAIRFIEETVWGKIPTLGNMQTLRITGESLGIGRATIVSEEIRSDRQVTDLIPTKFDASGDINGELSFGTFDPFMEGGMGSTWGDIISVDAAGVTVAGGKLVYPVNELPAFVLGTGVRLSGFTTASNNRIVVIQSINTATGECTTIPALTDETPVGNIRASGQPLANGSDDKSFYFEKEFIDVGKTLSYSGMVVDTMTMSVEAENKVTTSFSFMGKDGDVLPDGDTTRGPGAALDATTSEVMASSSQSGTALIDGVEEGLIKSMSIQVANGIRGKTVVGENGNVDMGKGRFNLTGNLSLYFRDFAIYQKFLENRGTSVIFTLSDVDGGTYVFYVPYLKFTESTVVAGGVDQDVMVDGTYQALLDPITGKSLIITRITA